MFVGDPSVLQPVLQPDGDAVLYDEPGLLPCEHHIFGALSTRGCSCHSSCFLNKTHREENPLK